MVFKSALAYQIKAYRIFGLWNTASSSLHYRIYGAIYQLTFSLVFIFFLVMSITEVKTMSETSESLYLSLTEICYLMKIGNIYFNWRKIQKLLDEIDSESPSLSNEEIAIFRKSNSVITKLTFAYLSTGALALAAGYAKATLTSEVILPFPAWYPWNWKNNRKNYWISFIYQAIGMFTNCTLNITSDSFQYTCINLTSVYLEIISNRVKINFAENMGIENSFKTLIECIKQHKKVMKLTVDVGELFSWVYFIQFLLSGVILCVTALQVSILSPLKYPSEFLWFIVYAASMLFQIFLPCYFGNNLMLQNSIIQQEIYFSNWIKQPVKFQKMLIIFRENLSRPAKITAASLFDLNLGTFTSILHSAYSLYAVLQKVQNG